MQLLRRLHLTYCQWVHCRKLFSKTGTWSKTFNKDVGKELEHHWKDRVVQEHTTSIVSKVNPQNKFYVLSMFPYPSGRLHMGHVRVYAISDTMAHFHRLNGRHVIHPMGWDAFGLPAENAAIERGEKPLDWTQSNIAHMKKQLQDMGFCFDWNTEFATCDPAYYKWTQYLFLKMYDAGLVYQKKGAVNWDPVDHTVLADEQIDDQGRSWRSGVVAERRFLRQWYIATTAYSQSLVEGLDEVDSQLWRDVVDLQRHWIGQCNGVRLHLPLMLDGVSWSEEGPLSVFTVTPEFIYGTSHILLSTQHLLNHPDYIKDTQSKTKELRIQAVNPFSGETIPVYISEDHDFGDHLDSHLAVPCVNEQDKLFADGHGLTYRQVLDQSSGSLLNSEQFTGLKRQEAFTAIAEYAKKLGHGGHVTSERARDWLISRQRYWGTPIPMIHCPKCGTVPVPYEDLPVTLPDLPHITGTGTSPLTSAENWVKVKCPKCQSDAQRETDTMDTFVDSSWYYLRYLDAHNQHEPFSKEAAEGGMPVDLYIGGKEHAIMHLYYARFFYHFLHSQGLVPSREPFKNLLTQGMVMGRSYKVKDTGKYIPSHQVELNADQQPVETVSGLAVETQWEKMSKSKYNGVDPQSVLEEFGSDTTRLCILANVAPKSDRHWSHDVFVGVLRWQSRIWSHVGDYMELRTSGATPVSSLTDEHEQQLFDMRNYYIKEVDFCMNQTFLLNTAISRLQTYTTDLRKVPVEVMGCSAMYERALCELVIMLTPFAPMFCAELWEGLRSIPHLTDEFNWEAGVFKQRWPVLHPDYRVKMKIKAGKRHVFDVHLPMPLSELDSLTRQEALALTESHPQFNEHFKNVDVSKVNLNVTPGVRAELLMPESDRKQKKKKTKSAVKL